MSRIAIIGSSGWLGAAITQELREIGEVECIGRDWTVDHQGLRERLRPNAGLVVVNAAGLLRGTVEQLNEANLALALRVVDALDGTGAHLIQLGSPAEYGDPGGAEPIPECAVPRPLTDYGWAKHRSSTAVLERPEWCVLRPFNVVDVDMVAVNPVGVIREQVREQVRRAGPSGGEIVLPAARAVRDHVSRAFIARSVRSAVQSRVGGAFNLCSGLGLSYQAIAEAIASELGVDLGIRDEDLPGIKAVVGDPSRWYKASGLAEALDAAALARLVLGHR